QVDTIAVSGEEWYYFSDTIPGKNFGDAWYDGTDYYFYLGSGVTTGEPAGGGAVPEMPAGTVPFVGVLCGFVYMTIRRSRKQ
ncbi:MAG: hypothetical protein ABIA77_02460, partial [Candidatus Omnitrophota bacterium]